jgi:hypothetical protein
LLLALLHDWRDFFIVTATAGATLIGAMFVVVSIAVGFLTRERAAAAHAYLTSTLVHLGAVLAASLVTMAPVISWTGFGVMLAAGGVIGVLYVALLVGAVNRYRADWTDLLWYTLLPIVGYAVLGTAGVLALATDARAVEVLAAATVLILICGVRNAWDMILTFASRPRANNNKE